MRSSTLTCWHVLIIHRQSILVNAVKPPRAQTAVLLRLLWLVWYHIPLRILLNRHGIAETVCKQLLQSIEVGPDNHEGTTSGGVPLVDHFHAIGEVSKTCMEVVCGHVIWQSHNPILNRCRSRLNLNSSFFHLIDWNSIELLLLRLDLGL